MKISFLKITSIIAGVLLLQIIPLNAQTLDIEKSFDPPSLTKDSYLSSVDYDDETETTVMTYVEKSATDPDKKKVCLFCEGMKIKTYTFDKDLNFIDEVVVFYTVDDFIERAKAPEHREFQTFGDRVLNHISSQFVKKYKGETYVKEWTDIQQMVGGKINVTKRKVTYNFIWAINEYVPTYEKPITASIKSEEQQDKIYLYKYVSNTKTGDTYLIVGNKAPKKSNIKALEARNFQIIKVTKDLEVEYLEEFKFEKNMCISFEKIMHIGEKIESGVKDDDGEKGVPEIDGALFYMVFAPVSGGGKENMSQDMGASRLVGMDDNGKLVSQLDFSAPTSGWNIMNMIKSPYANDYYLFGPAKDEVYVNKIAKVISPLDYNQAVNDIKFKNYQVMKISEGKVVYVNSTPLESFETQASSPPSQKSIPEYEGKNFNRRIEFITKDGEILLGGQNFQEKNKADDAGNKWVETKYQDLILVHFDTAGKLKRSYGVKRDNMNKYSKASVTPMDIYLSPNGKNLYWVYGEIEGMRKDWGFGEKLLYFPAVAKVDLENATISDFTYMGADAEGKQRFYTHPAVDQILSEDGKKMIFVGEDKKGTLIWLAKMNVI